MVPCIVDRADLRHSVGDIVSVRRDLRVSPRLHRAAMARPAMCRVVDRVVDVGEGVGVDAGVIGLG